jgi:hypothetical protein
MRDRHATTGSRVRFVITPINHQCMWHVSPNQPDGSTVTQVAGHFMVKNRTNEPLYLISAKLTKPRIPGETLPGLLTIQSTTSSMHGTSHISGHFIPPGATLPVSATILIRGTPRQKSGPMKATIEMMDADSNRERVHLTLSLR